MKTFSSVVGQLWNVALSFSQGLHENAYVWKKAAIVNLPAETTESRLLESILLMFRTRPQQIQKGFAGGHPRLRVLACSLYSFLC
jgi:hypothetical protein